MALLIFALLHTASAVPLSPGVDDVAPFPRAAHSPVEVIALQGGYRVYLNRRMSERLVDALEGFDPKDVAAKLQQLAKENKEADRPDEDAAKTLEMIAFVVSTQLPDFKKSLAEKIGPNGAVIMITGFQLPTVKFKQPRPKLEKAAEVVRGVMPLLPEEARQVVEAMRAVARTTPLFWKAEHRE